MVSQGYCRISAPDLGVVIDRRFSPCFLTSPTDLHMILYSPVDGFVPYEGMTVDEWVRSLKTDGVLFIESDIVEGVYLDGELAWINPEIFEINSTSRNIPLYGRGPTVIEFSPEIEFSSPGRLESMIRENVDMNFKRA